MPNFGLFFFFCSDLPNFWHASYKLIGEHFFVFFSLVFSRLFREITHAKKTLTSLVAFFAFLLLREKQNRPFVSITFFCIRYILKTKIEPAEKCFPINL